MNPTAKLPQRVMHSAKVFSIFCVLFRFLLTSVVFAQTVSVSQISGTVKDASGAVVPAAQVQVTKTDTGLSKTTSSDSNGLYLFPDLPIGPYELEVKASGFSPYRQSGIILEVGSSPEIDPVIQVGAIQQEVVVTSNATMVETQSSGVGQVINQQQVVDLPLNGREVTQLIFLSGAATTGTNGDLNTSKNYPTVTISVGGGLSTGLMYMLDGAYYDDDFNGLNLPLPFPDALQEFKVQTSALPAEYGQHSAGVINAVTKSGTNSYHGDAFDFVRNYLLNARDPFSSARDSLKRNQFGGTIGGPIKKDKLFFFGGYQYTVVKSNPPSTTTPVFTAAMKNGDFSIPLSSACLKTPVKLGAPFVNNVLPASAMGDIDAVSLAILQKVPVATNQCGLLTYAIPQNTNEHLAAGRGDYQLSQKQQIFARYTIGDYNNPSIYNGTNILTTTKAGVSDKDQSFTLGDTFTLNSSMVNAAHVTLNRTRNLRQVLPFPCPHDVGINVYCLQPGLFLLSITGGFSTAGGATNPAHNLTTYAQGADDFDVVRGNHHFTFGVDFVHDKMIEYNSQFANGSYSFNGQATGAGQGLADFLLGDLTADTQGNFQRSSQGRNYIGAYGQDSWKATSRLTMNAGMRWEPFLPMYSPYEFAEHFDQTGYEDNQISRVYVNAPPGFTFPGDRGFPGTADTRKKWLDFAPRLGVVWDPMGNGRMTIRGAYGVFFDLPQLFYNAHVSNAPPFGETVAIPSCVNNDVADSSGVAHVANTSTDCFADPFADFGSNPFPSLFTLTKGIAFVPQGVYTNFPLNQTPPYLQQWNLSIEKQIGANSLFSVTYLGNETSHLQTEYDANPGIYVPGVANSSGVCTFPDSSASFAIAPGAACSTTGTLPHRRLLSELNSTTFPDVPSPDVYHVGYEGGFISTLETLDNGGTASYNSLLVSFQHRLSNNYTLLANYTWAHCISDPLSSELQGAGPGYSDVENTDYQAFGFHAPDRRFDRGNCGQDVHSTINLSLVAHSPKFSGRLTEALLGNWQWSVISTANTGLYINPTLNTDVAENGQTSQRPNFGTAPGSEYINTAPVPGSTYNRQFLRAADFTAPAPGALTTTLEAFQVHAPGEFDIDTGLAKLIPLGEAKSIELRAEFFNVLNRVNYNAPSTSVGTSAFGQISSDVAPRIGQLALKFNF